METSITFIRGHPPSVVLRWNDTRMTHHSCLSVRTSLVASVLIISSTEMKRHPLRISFQTQINKMTNFFLSQIRSLKLILHVPLRLFMKQIYKTNFEKAQFKSNPLRNNIWISKVHLLYSEFRSHTLVYIWFNSQGRNTCVDIKSNQLIKQNQVFGILERRCTGWRPLGWSEETSTVECLPVISKQFFKFIIVRIGHSHTLLGHFHLDTILYSVIIFPEWRVETGEYCMTSKLGLPRHIKPAFRLPALIVKLHVYESCYD